METIQKFPFPLQKHFNKEMSISKVGSIKIYIQRLARLMKFQTFVCALIISAQSAGFEGILLQFLLSPLLPVSSLQVSITTGANPTAGESYIFTCTVTPQEGFTGTPTVQWRGPGSSDPITSGGDFVVSSAPLYSLTINPLRQYHDGQYTCQATIGNTTGSSSVTLTVAGD